MSGRLFENPVPSKRENDLFGDSAATQPPALAKTTEIQGTYELSETVSEGKKKKGFWSKVTKVLLPWLTSALLLVLVVALIAWFAYREGLNNAPLPPPCEDPHCVDGEPVGSQVDYAPLSAWLRMTSEEHLIAKRTQRVFAKLDPLDGLVLGLYERDIARDNVAAHISFNLAASSGQLHARGLRDRISLNASDRLQAYTGFAEYLRRGGREGHFRLAQHYLGEYVADFANAADEELPFCLPNDFIPEADIEEAYIYFKVAELCDYTPAYEWRAMVGRALTSSSDTVRLSTLDERAVGYLRSRLDRADGDRDAVCFGEPVIDGPGSDRTGRRLSTTGSDLGDPEIVGPLPFRRKPDQSRAPDPGDPDAAHESAPSNEDGTSASADPDREQDPRLAAMENDAKARYWLNRGNAEFAIGNLDAARQHYQRAIDIGRPYGSQASLIAARRIQVLSLTCEFTSQSISRIARDNANNPETGGLIGVHHRQKALRALGYYQGRIDGKYGKNTSAAVRSFQREIGSDETGDLTPVETVVLICSAAQNQRDIDAQNMLGIMYATGLGVVQNTDLALEWMKASADRGNPEALYNLAILYGTQTIVQSYRLCDIVESYERADAYLKEAADRGHEGARALWRAHQGKTPQRRWTDIKTNDLNLPARLQTPVKSC